MEDKLVNAVYDKMSEYFFEDIDDKDKKDLENGYKKYLKAMYSNLLKDNKYFDIAVELFFNVELKKWAAIDEITKLKLLVNDEILNRIKYLASIINKNAYLKRDLKNDEIEVNDCYFAISEMQEIYENVKYYNLELSKGIYNESLKNYNFVLGFSEYSSLDTINTISKINI